MDNQELDLLLENHSLKFEFALRDLDLAQVFCPTPDDLKRENRFLYNLLDWVQKYGKYGERFRLELEGYHFPPIEPGISPESDWCRFELWMQGKPTRQKLKEQLPHDYAPKNPENLTDEEILAELEELTAQLVAIRVCIDIQEDIPPRLVYEDLLEVLDEEFDILGEGFWHLGGCTGYCPGCFQRPWCETGSQSCWQEDEQAGKMFLIDSVRSYVSASSISLPILRKLQADEDRKFAEFTQDQNGVGIQIDPLPFDFDDEFPF